MMDAYLNFSHEIINIQHNYQFNNTKSLNVQMLTTKKIKENSLPFALTISI